MDKVPRIALVGNPNTGKSTVFNALTGLRQRTGNYPGVTVERKLGKLTLGEKIYEVLDVPGTYSLDVNSPDEKVVVDALSGLLPNEPAPELIVAVIDASNLRRNLFLAMQLAELGVPMVIALNQWDVAERLNIRIDVERLRSRLGVPVVPLSAKKGLGLEELKQAMKRNLDEQRRPLRPPWPASFDEAVSTVQQRIKETSGQQVPLFLARRLLFDNNPRVAQSLGLEAEETRNLLSEARGRILKTGYNPSNAEVVIAYQHIDAILDQAIETDPNRPHSSDSIDRLLCHRVWGLAVFIGLMAAVFQSVYAWAGPFMDLIDGFFGALAETVGPWLSATPMLQSLVVDGVIGGVGGVVIFLPQIFILFFFVGLLEDTGYMSRAAFLMDKAFGWCGLNGKCFIPLLSSYACAIPGIMSARTIEDPKARLATVLVAPLMSCSARLPVYVLFIGAFIEPAYGPTVAGITLLAMHFVGLIVAAPLVAVLNRYILMTPPQPFLLEMPSYKIPKLSDMLLRVLLKGREFLANAGTIIFAFSIIIWALLYFPHPEALEGDVRQQFIQEIAMGTDQSPDSIATAIDAEQPNEIQERFEQRLGGVYLEQSYLARFGKAIQPVFDPAGFDWKITVGLVASFPARELIVSTLGIIYQLGAETDEESDDLRKLMQTARWPEGTHRAGQPIFTIPVALAVMVFFALCMQCGATLATMARETGWSWAAAAFFINTALAWINAVLVYQAGTFLFG